MPSLPLLSPSNMLSTPSNIHTPTNFTLQYPHSPEPLLSNIPSVSLPSTCIILRSHTIFTLKYFCPYVPLPPLYSLSNTHTPYYHYPLIPSFPTIFTHQYHNHTPNYLHLWIPIPPLISPSNIINSTTITLWYIQLPPNLHPPIPSIKNLPYLTTFTQKYPYPTLFIVLPSPFNILIQQIINHQYLPIHPSLSSASSLQAHSSRPSSYTTFTLQYPHLMLSSSLR